MILKYPVETYIQITQNFKPSSHKGLDLGHCSQARWNDNSLVINKQLPFDGTNHWIIAPADGTVEAIMNTYATKPSDIQRKWFVVDAEGVVLGRLSAEIAKILRGKHKPSYVPNLDCGDYVVVINAEKVKLTGHKLTQKKYFKHTGYVGGIKETTPAKILAGRFPERIIEKAVERMISRNPLGRQQMTKLKVYAGSEHPHSAQNPEVLDIASRNPKNKRSAL